MQFEGVRIERRDNSEVLIVNFGYRLTAEEMERVTAWLSSLPGVLLLHLWDAGWGSVTFACDDDTDGLQERAKAQLRDL